jgi:hypothetical protein
MPELDFLVESAEPVALAAAPTLAFKLRVSQCARSGPPAPIHAVALRCQIRFDPAKRRYMPAEGDRLRDLFGTTDRFSQTLRPMLWTHVSAVVPPFTDWITVDFQVPCTFDFNVAATKYFYALEDGEVPLSFLFSGTVFHETEDAGLQVAQISWDKEAGFRLPVRIWREMMELYYPNSAWLTLRRDVFDQLYDFKVRQGVPTWEQVIERLLAHEERLIPR